MTKLKDKFEKLYNDVVKDKEIDVVEWDFIIRVNDEYIKDKSLLHCLEQEFGVNSVIAEDNSDDPLDYSLKAFSDLAFMPYVLAADNIEDISAVIEASGEFTEAFQGELSAFLKKHQSPAKYLFNKRLRAIVDPVVGANFVESFANKS